MIFRRLIVLSALLPLLVGASGSVLSDRLKTDLADFVETLDRLDTEEEERAASAMREADSALFPDESESSAAQRRGILEEDPEFLTVRIDGVPVVLTDVPRVGWFAPYVRDAAKQGIVSGYRGEDGRPTGRFGPENPVTIEELAKMALRSSGVDEESCAGELRNASARERWSETFIRCAEERGLAVFSDGTIDVARPARRSEVVVTILQVHGYTITPLMGTGRIFSDVFSSTEFASAIEVSARLGIISGDTAEDGVPLGTFRPEASVNRAEVAKIVMLAVQLLAAR